MFLNLVRATDWIFKKYCRFRPNTVRAFLKKTKQKKTFHGLLDSHLCLWSSIATFLEGHREDRHVTERRLQLGPYTSSSLTSQESRNKGFWESATGKADVAPGIVWEVLGSRGKGALPSILGWGKEVKA